MAWSPLGGEDTPRARHLARLRALVDAGTPIIGAGAGTGISAKFEAKGGADMIIIYNSGKFRMSGHGSLAGLMPYKDANAMMLEMGEETLATLEAAGSEVPLLAGICATDPCRRMGPLLAQVRDMGFAGVQNFPTVGLIDGVFRENLEETGMTFHKEIEMIRAARRLGLLTTPYAFDEAQAAALAEAGADVIVAHMGLTTAGSIGAKTALSLEVAAERTQAMCDAARAVRADVIVLCHGGPIASPEDAQFVLRACKGVNGFYGASSAERLPTEVAIARTMREFKAISF